MKIEFGEAEGDYTISWDEDLYGPMPLELPEMLNDAFFELVQRECAECGRTAAMYGGRAADEIAELILKRNQRRRDDRRSFDDQEKAPAGDNPAEA